MIRVYSIVGMKIIIKAVKEQDGYGIECIQLDSLYRITDRVHVRGITSDKRFINEIFSLIVKYKAFSCSICEIIEDLLC